ncbi:AMP-binding protein [Rhodococcus gordoniae]|uniref:AMP-binding protein n=1 Tax=Rhodococcus gordoniae TaxID=223392 RepID=UPI0035269BE0
MFSSPILDERPGVRFVRRLQDFGDTPALITSERTVTYSELAAQVRHETSRLGETRRLVLLAGANEIDVIIVYLAALLAGHPVLLAPGDNPVALEGLIDAYRPDVVVRSIDGTVAVEERGDGSSHVLHPDLALLLSTSGSTGSPKLVRLSHRNVQSNAESIADYLGIRGTDRAVTTLPMHYCYGLSVIHSHLLRGAAVVLTTRSVTDPAFWELFRAHGGTSFAGVPYTFDLLDRFGFDELDLPDLRYITQAGGRLSPDRVRAYAQLGRERGWDFFVMYGQTEATARMAYLPPELATDHPQSIGRAVPGGSFRLEAVPDAPDGTGELIYTGPNVMLGYAHTPEDLGLGDILEGELRTGDLARQIDGGLYEVVGRRSRFVKLFGLRLDLQQIESTLAQEGLTACCVGGTDEMIVAVEGASDVDAVRSASARACGLPVAAVRVCLVDELPRTSTGKPDLRAVAGLVHDAAPVPVTTTTTVVDTDALRALYAEVLRSTQVTDDSSFVSLGGDSLSYVQMSLRLERMLGCLPENWHTTAIKDFVPAPRRRWWRTVETNVLLRAVAIVLIVGSHIRLFGALGGAHVLLGVAGYNFARFHLATPRTERVRHVLGSVARIAVPSMLWLAAVIALTGDYLVTSAFLLNGILGPDGWTPEWRYWFIEAIVYILLVVIAVLSIPLVDRIERKHSFWFAIGLVGVGLLPRYGIVELGDGNNLILSASMVFWLFALGWAAATATTVWHRAGVTAVIAATVPGYFSGDLQRELLVIGGLCLLVWLDSVPCPPALSRIAGVLASASLYIYLTHFQVYLPLREDHPWLAFALSILVGILFWQGVTAVLSLRRRLGIPRSRDDRDPIVSTDSSSRTSATEAHTAAGSRS